MSERYAKLFSLPENLYITGSPVILAAGNLLKDNQSSKVIAQLKLRSISEREIIAVKVKIVPFDAAGETLGAATEHQFLDLHIGRDEEFGSKTPIFLPNAATRSYAASVSEVVFADKTVWHTVSEVWETLDAPETLESVLVDEETVKQYRLQYGADSKYKMLRQKDLWHCTCGALNRQEEIQCHRCNREFAALDSAIVHTLETQRDDRLAEERRQAEVERIKAEKENQARKAKTKRIAIILTVVAIFLVGVYIAVTTVSKNRDYNAAVVRLKTAKVGDNVTFGAYEQDNNTANGKEEIKWRVLAKQDGKILMISEYALDCKQYNTRHESVTWETCTLRTWLNKDFFNAAFSAAEQSMIPTVTVSADENPSYSTSQGNNTRDKVFLLSIVEADKHSAGGCKPTEYAVANGAYSDSVNGNCWWWLRSLGDDQNFAACVSELGVVSESGYLFYSACFAVRPAIWVSLGD